MMAIRHINKPTIKVVFMDYLRKIRHSSFLKLMRPFIALAGVSLSGFALAENCTALPTSGNIYNIVNQGSGKYMEVAGASTSNGANVQQWASNGYKNQQYTLTDMGNGVWSIRPVHSNQSVDLYNWSTVDGGTIKQWPYWGGQAQQWKLSQSGTGAVNIASAYTGKLISVADSQQGSDVFQKSDQGSTYQGWYFNPVNGSCGSPAKLIGFAAIADNGLSTTTGGGNAKPIRVDDCDTLADALRSSDPAVVQIPDKALDCRTQPRIQQACALTCGRLEPENPNKMFYWVETPGNACEGIAQFINGSFKGRVNRTKNERTIVVKSNKTLEGLGPNSRVLGVSFRLNDVSNIIIRNLAIEKVNPELIEAGDAISMSNTHHIWLDHLRTKMISDGHVDMYNSRNVTVSWSRFSGENPKMCGGMHSYVNLVHDNSQATYHHNYWYNTDGRNPKVGKKSKVHLFNNFWQNIKSYSIDVSDQSEAKIEGNYFENARQPHKSHDNGLIDADLSSNVYTGSSATDSVKDHGSTLSWRVPYTYQRDSADKAHTDIINQSGPR
jgi:pectate lyase